MTRAATRYAPHTLGRVWLFLSAAAYSDRDAREIERLADKPRNPTSSRQVALESAARVMRERAERDLRELAAVGGLLFWRQKPAMEEAKAFAQASQARHYGRAPRDAGVMA